MGNSLRHARRESMALSYRELKIDHQNQGILGHADFRHAEIPQLALVPGMGAGVFQKLLRFGCHGISKIAPQAGRDRLTDAPDVEAGSCVAHHGHVLQADVPVTELRRRQDVAIECIPQPHALPEDVQGRSSGELRADAQLAAIALDARPFEIGKVALRLLVAMYIPAALLREELFSQHAFESAELEMQFHGATPAAPTP